MLIQRTIRNPKEKLYLLLRFIRDNKLYADLFEGPMDGIFKRVYVKRAVICEALKIKPPVLKSWSEKRSSNTVSYIVNEIYDIRIMIYTERYSNGYYIELNHLCVFLYSQYLQDQVIKQIPQAKEFRDIINLFENLDTWYKQ